MHYSRWIRTGSPGEVGARIAHPSLSLRERFDRVGWDVVLRRPEIGPCWEWRGNRIRRGYGRLAVGKQKTAGAHRVSFELHIGPIPVGLSVLHHCDNPPCVNPAHLFPGSAQDNRDDMVSKGRDSRGDRNFHLKLSDADISVIRARHAAGGITQTALGIEYGVWQTTIGKIVRNKIRV
jgi:hypothetical protein